MVLDSALIEYPLLSNKALNIHAWNVYITMDCHYYYVTHIFFIACFIVLAIIIHNSYYRIAGNYGEGDKYTIIDDHVARHYWSHEIYC